MNLFRAETEDRWAALTGDDDDFRKIGVYANDTDRTKLDRKLYLTVWGPDGGMSDLKVPEGCTPEVAAFAAGRMPPFVLADVLEERWPEFPRHGLELLRGPYETED